MTNSIQVSLTNFSDVHGGRPECPNVEPIPQTSDEVVAMLEQKYFSKLEYGRPWNYAAADAYDSSLELYEEELLGERAQTDEEIQDEEDFKVAYNASLENEKGRKEGKRGRQGEEGGIPRTPCFDSAPPIDNMGLHKHVNEEFFPSVVSNENLPRFGGYDGGVEVGFNGYWSSPAALQAVAVPLRAGQKEARSKTYQESVEIDLNGRKVEISAKGASCGPYYEFVFESRGVKFYIHGNPYKDGKALVENFQAIRIRYDATILMRMPLHEVHQETLQFLSDLGFNIKSEKVSRVDLQVIVPVAMKEFGLWYIGRYFVCRARGDSWFRNNGRVETITLGNKNRIQLCIYDKRVEMKKAGQSETLKDVLFIENCCGQEWYDSRKPITRVEYRIGREVLKEFEIDTIDDLAEREKGLVAYLTTDWFRVLKEPKHRGHENEQEIHPDWLNVQKMFGEWFTGHPERPDKELKRREKPVVGETGRLIKQACGCFSTIAARSIKLSSECEDEGICRLLESVLSGNNVAEMTKKAYKKQVVIETKTGCKIGDKRELNHEKNCGMANESVNAVGKKFCRGISLFYEPRLE